MWEKCRSNFPQSKTMIDFLFSRSNRSTRFSRSKISIFPMKIPHELSSLESELRRTGGQYWIVWQIRVPHFVHAYLVKHRTCRITCLNRFEYFHFFGRIYSILIRLRNRWVLLWCFTPKMTSDFYTCNHACNLLIPSLVSLECRQTPRVYELC